MKRLRQTLLLVAVTTVVPACYHATVELGRPPSAQVVDKPFASSWVYGLVPPSTVQAASQCPNGVAKVETQLSFVNGLVSFLTLGIYTPMQITVTCAAGASSSGFLEIQPEDDSPEAAEIALATAVRQATEQRRPAYVRLR